MYVVDQVVSESDHSLTRMIDSQVARHSSELHAQVPLSMIGALRATPSHVIAARCGVRLASHEDERGVTLRAVKVELLEQVSAVVVVTVHLSFGGATFVSVRFVTHSATRIRTMEVPQTV